MRHRTYATPAGWMLAMACLLAPLAASAEGVPALEALIARDNPCADLPGIDRLDFVRVDRMALVAEGERLTATLSGALGCESSGSALIPASVSTAIEARVAVRLPGCAVVEAEATLSDIGGTAGPILSALRPEAESALADEIAGLAQDTCEGLLAE